MNSPKNTSSPADDERRMQEDVSSASKPPARPSRSKRQEESSEKPREEEDFQQLLLGKMDQILTNQGKYEERLNHLEAAFSGMSSRVSGIEAAASRNPIFQPSPPDNGPQKSSRSPRFARKDGVPKRNLPAPKNDPIGAHYADPSNFEFSRDDRGRHIKSLHT